MMNDKKLERIAKVITALLFVVSVTMFVTVFFVQPAVLRSYEEVSVVDSVDAADIASVEPEKPVEPEITHLAVMRVPMVVKPLEAIVETADVVLNRVADDRFPDSIYEVLMQERQYGRYHWTGVIWPERANLESERDAVDRAYQIAEEVLSGSRHSALYGQGYIWQAEFIQGSDTVTCDCGGTSIYFGR